MVIADAESPGPVRKRAKLSLKLSKKGDLRANSPATALVKEEKECTNSIANGHGAVKEEPFLAGDVSEDITDRKSVCEGENSFQDTYVVPAVSSLENLGNTCFLNSVLQILRFTPGFLDRLDDLHQELVTTEKLKKQDLSEEDDEYKSPLTSQLVKFLHHLYHRMDKLEERHGEVATSDVMSMAVKPEKILNTIRELNPMFEGYLQHDAQELLRCILCYLQDAEKEIVKLKASISPSVLQNLFTASLPQRKHEERRPNSISESPLKDQDMFHENLSSVSSKVSRLVENMCIELNENVSMAAKVQNIEHDKIPECQIADVASFSNVTKDSSSESSSVNVKRKRKPKSKALNSDLDKQHSEMNGITGNHDNSNSQPSILTMLKPNGPCKRLGMRGAVVKNGKNNVHDVHDNISNNCCPEVMDVKIEDKNDEFSHKSGFDELDGDCPTLPNGLSHSPKPKGMDSTDVTKNGDCSDMLDSKAKKSVLERKHISRFESPVKCQSPIKNSQVVNSPFKSGIPVVKLEKCDHVCDSPKKSVSVALATRTLSPFKVNMPKSKNAMNAISRLDFSEKGQKLNEKKKHDFVEKLFMGTLMICTRCLECESSREKIEEFHDISVAVHKEKREDSDDEGDEKDEDSTEENEDRSTLHKLMESFGEVERLKGDNKYFCDKCEHLVEAERSLHYNVMPDILSVHLKRFSSVSGAYGYVSKINDHIKIPLSLPCLRHKCPRPCSRSDHRHHLYGLIAHAGVTLTSGHYLTYVKVNRCGQDGQLISQSSIRSNNSLVSQSQRALISSNLNYRDDTPSKFTSVPTEKYEGCWLECDDEAIKVHSEEEFCQMLKGEDSSLLGTPYVLFYHK